MQIEQFDRLVRGLYDGVMAPEGWCAVLDQLRILTESAQVAFLVLDKRTNTTVIADIANFDLPFIEDYQKNFARSDPGQLAVERTALGQWYVDVRDLGLGTIRSHDFYQVFMRTHGMGSVLTTPLLRDDNTLAGLSFLTGKEQRNSQTEITQRFALLMPHLLQATALRWRFRDLSRLAQLGQHVLDHVKAPVLVVDAKASIVYANHAGQLWLNEKQQPFSQQAIRKKSDIGAGLRQLARQICDTKHSAPSVGGLKLKSLGDEAPTYLVGLPLRDAHPLSLQWSQPIGIIVVHELSARKTTGLQIMRQLFGLTPAELRVLEVLPTQDSLHASAVVLGVTHETVRSQLKSIYQKTDMHTQMALSRLILQFSQVH